MRRFSLVVVALIMAFAQLCAAQQTRTNVVCFVRFADEDETVFTNSPQHYEKLFNAEGEGVNSVYSYFKWVSYGNLDWKSVILPRTDASSTIVASYKDTAVRASMRPKNANNPDGYTGGDLGGSLAEQNLIKRACEYLTSLYAESGLPVNTIDNLTIVYSGNSERRSADGILWPHQDMMRWKQAEICGKRVGRYLIVFDAANGYALGKPKALNTGVICHEMSHALGTYDLYSSDSFSPVGIWDLMSNNQLVPQGMTAYMRQTYGGWIANVEEITSDGTYTLNPLGGSSPNGVAYKIAGENGEYFMLEYRKKEGVFESSLPSSGLLCYRINQAAKSNLQKPYELYIFRPGGTVSTDGNVKNAALSADLGNTELNTSTALSAIFYSNGNLAPFAIKDVSAAGETISFSVVMDIAGVDNIEDNENLVYYDNSQRIIIAPEEAQVSIYSFSGVKISDDRDLNSLESGAYIAVVEYKGVRRSIKIIMR